MHKSLKLRLQRSHETPDCKSTAHYLGKTAVMGMLDRERGKVRAAVVPDRKNAIRCNAKSCGTR